MRVIDIVDSSQLNYHLTHNDNKLVVVKFTAVARCEKCLSESPVFGKLSETFPRAVFLKVDVDFCPIIAARYNLLSAYCCLLPTIIFFRNRVQVDSVSGEEKFEVLEPKILKYYGTDSAPKPPEGQMDLLPYIKQCEMTNAWCNCLINCLTYEHSFLQSMYDKQLILSVFFSQAVKIHSIRIKAPSTNGPKIVKLVIDQPKFLAMHEAANNIPTDILVLDNKMLETAESIKLNSFRFKSVQDIHLFIEDNQDQSDITCINYVQLLGSPIINTNIFRINYGSVKNPKHYPWHYL